MKKTDLQRYKNALLIWRARLRGDVDQLTNEALKKNRQESSGDLSNMPVHLADLGTDNFEQEFTLTLLENEEDTLAQIEKALDRIAQGAYGTCEECGQPIAKLRLQAIPYTPHCVECARKSEQTR